MNDLKELIKTYDGRKKNGLVQEVKRNECLVSQLKEATRFLDDSSSISERLYCVINRINSRPVCSCGNQLSFLKISRGYAATCGDPKCIHDVRSKNAKRIDASMDWKEVARKAAKTNTIRYGASTSLRKNSSLYKKRQDTMMNRYGTVHPLNNDDILSRQKRTTIERYGTLDMLHTDRVQDTIMNKYGVSHPMKNTEVAKRSGENSSNTKNGNINARLSSMNLSPISHEGIFYDLMCNGCGRHLHNITRYLINFTYRNGTSPCHHCYPHNHFRSKGEEEMVHEISSFYDGEVQLNRQYLGAEVDIIIPEKRLCIEYNGLYWHSELFKTREYHVDKKKLIESKGYNLVYVWEDDWADDKKRKIIVGRIRSKMGMNNRVYARKCKVVDVSPVNSVKFLEDNHLHGSAASSIRIGLQLDDELVMLLTFGKTRNSIGGSHHGYELIRSCSKVGVNVVGGFSKLMHHFSLKYGGPVYSYVDLDWSMLDGTSYDSVGFRKVGTTGPGYQWVVNGRRINRLNFQKHKIANTPEEYSMSEAEIMHSRGFYRTWNTGNLKYEWMSNWEDDRLSV